MQLVTLIVIVICLWFVYALLQSYKNIERELREIRVKCVLPTKTKSNPVESMKDTIVSGLSRMASSI